MSNEQAAQFIQDSLKLHWNDLSAVEEILNEQGFIEAAKKIHAACNLLYEVANTPR